MHDVVVSRTAFSTGLFNGGTPFLLMGSVAGCIEALEQVVAPLGARTIVPGHGPVFEGTARVA